MELSDCLLTLLGKPESDPDFQAFWADMNEQATVRIENGIKTLHFHKLGFSLHADAVRNVYEAIFHVSTRAVKFGTFLPYQGLLPHGVTPEDTRSEVEAKLGVKPYSTQKLPFDDFDSWWDAYHISPLGFLISYWSPVGNMIMFRVRYQLEPSDPLAP